MCDLRQTFEQITKATLHGTEYEAKLNVTTNTLHKRGGKILIIIRKQNKKIDLFSETEIVTCQHNRPGLQFTCASGPGACGCRSGRSLVVDSAATPRPALMRFILHRFPSFFKRTAPLRDTNI
jgi:hypothetical protein